MRILHIESGNTNTIKITTHVRDLNQGTKGSSFVP